MQRYAIMLVADAVELRTALGGNRHPRLKARLLRLGHPLVERSGVTGRRLLWAHDFPSAIADGTRVIEFDDGDGGAVPASVTVTLQSDFPADWRFPLTP